LIKSVQETFARKGSILRLFEENWHYLVIAALSIVTFALLYGVAIIDPTYTDWLLGKGDLSQHYIGWQAFKNSSWLFPIGMTDQLAYPYHTSIIFTDSIPVFAVFFKLFRAVLPTEFQYFGIWGVLCFVLQGIFAVRIIQRFVPNRIYVILTSMLFVIAPVMLFRMYMHTALAGQWLILFALDTFFANKTASGRAIYLRWAALGMLSASTHLYFLLLSGIVLAGSCLEEVIRTRRLKKAVVMLMTYLLSGAIVVALLGGFSSAMDASTGGLGIYSFNLNAFFNPQGWSSILPDLPTYGFGQYEGFAYLGAGILVLVALSLVAIVIHKNTRAHLRAHTSQLIALGVVFLVTLFASLSPTITLNGNRLVKLPIPYSIRELWAIFRATGRIGWIMVYLLMLGGVIVSYSLFNRRGAVVLAAIVLGLQVYDIQAPLLQRHEEFSQNVVYQSQLTDTAFWNSIVAEHNIRHVVLIPRFSQLSEEMRWSLANWAMDNRLTLNDFYFARENTAIFNQNQAALIACPDASEVFIVNPANAMITEQLDLNYYLVDGLIVGTLAPVPGQKSIDPTAYSVSHYTFGDGYVDKGVEKDGARYLYEGGTSFGPFWTLPKGTYQIVVSGAYLSLCDVSAHSLSNKVRHKVSAFTAREDQLSFTVTVEEDTFTFEVCVLNQASDEARLDSIDITRVG